MNIRRLLKRFFRSIGLEVSRLDSPPMLLRRMEWLGAMGIRSVLDIGANTGQFAASVREVLPNAQIYSFEPLADCHARLLARMRGDAHFAAFHCALGSVNAKTEIHRNQFSPASSLLPMHQIHKDVFPFATESRPERIEVARLDDVRPELDLHPNVLIKVDVQGYESEVIAGGMNTFAEASLAVIETGIEPLYEAQPLFSDIFDQMRDLGFSFGGVLDQLLRPDGRPLQADVIFLRERI